MNQYSSLQNLVKKIEASSSILLSTHKQGDGDGLGAQIGLYHALKKQGKNVRILNVDETPEKYRFLQTDQIIQCFDAKYDPIEKTDLALILDTNDQRLIDPLFPELEKKCAEICFIDHHPILDSGPPPSIGSFIDTNAASTGELAFQVIESLDIELDFNIAQAIYTSIAFDTHLFRYVRNSPTSHLIAAKLLEHEIQPADIHRRLFANHSVDKIRFLSHSLEKTEYSFDGRLAILSIQDEDLEKYQMTQEDSRDLIDFLMNIDTLVVGATLRRQKDGLFKISLRSKGQIEVQSLAESLQGGGHLYAAGATCHLSLEQIKSLIAQHLKLHLESA